jgi:PKD repeat protein
MRVKEIVAALCLIAVPAFAAGPNLVVNGDFEQNGGPGTSVLNGWTISNQSGGSGSWFAQKGDMPQLAIAYNCPTGCVAGAPVNFSATSPSYVFQACDAYAWDFGDGSSGALSNPTRAFAAPGTYLVHLVVTNALGTTSAATSVTIAPVPPRQRTVRR